MSDAARAFLFGALAAPVVGALWLALCAWLGRRP